MILKQIYNKIKEYERIIIHGHIRPDGDCYGAQFGLKNIIKETYPSKEVYVVGEKSEFVSFVGTIDKIEDSLYEGALSIVVDTATSTRVSDQRYKLGKEIIKIDHHIPIDDYGDYIWVDTTFPSCAQMIAYFYTQFSDLKINKSAAVAMYVGILTDTGRFKYRGVSRLTHELVGLLLDSGVDLEEVEAHMSTDTLETLRFKGYVYQNFKTTEKGFIYLKITEQTMLDYNLTYEEASAVVNLLSGVSGYPIWALFIETDGEIRVRLRSSGPQIDKLANKFRGGGHAKASGATLSSWEELSVFIKAVNEIL